MKKKQITNDPAEKKHQEFSKKVINLMILLWFAAAVFSMSMTVFMIICGVYDSVQMMINDLLLYVGVPMGGGIVGYLLKSAVENKEKIKGSHQNVSGEENINGHNPDSKCGDCADNGGADGGDYTDSEEIFTPVDKNYDR